MTLQCGGVHSATCMDYDPVQRLLVVGRGLHPSTFRLNVSALCGIGGAFMGGIGGVQWVLWGIRGCLGCILCQKRLRVT